MRLDKKNKLLQLRRWRTRKKVVGSAERPRMSVKFSNENIYVQFIDDATGTTLASTSTISKQLSEKGQLSANVNGAKKLGAVAAAVAKAKNIVNVVFDRSGACYHGKVKALADAAREAGLKF